MTFALKYRFRDVGSFVMPMSSCSPSIPLQGLPRKLARKRRLGVFLDRVGISHDLALVTGNESLFPVAKLQTILAELNSKVKRKVLVLDIRFAKQRGAKLNKFIKYYQALQKPRMVCTDLNTLQFRIPFSEINI